MFAQAISRDSLILGLFAIITTGLCVATFAITKDQIALNKELALEKALLEVVPADTHDNNMLEDTVSLNHVLLGNDSDVTAYIAKKGSQPVAVVLPVTAPEGYGGPINLLIGIYADGSIAGVRIVPPHKETPGLGDKIDTKKSDWILGFTGKSLSQPKLKKWKVKKDGGNFDSFTGATITPRAVVKAVQQALIYFQDHRFDILKVSSEMQATKDLKQ